MLLRVKLPHLITFLLGLGLLTYTSLRAHLLGMTHDESGSFLFWMDFPIFESFFKPGMWPDANLHWLYVFFMKISVGVFGDSEWAIRLPSLLAHVCYMFFSWKNLSLLTNRPWAVLAGFILINVNLYILDFFGLARGYGLALAFIVVSLYYFGKWARDGKPRYAVILFGTAIFSVLSNLTALNYYASIAALFLVICLQRYSVSKRRMVFASFTTALVFSGILFFLLKTPIQGLREGNKLYYGADSFLATFYTLIENSLYNAKPFERNNVEIISALFVSLFLFSFGLSVLRYLKNKNDWKNQYQLAISLLPIILLLGTIVQNLLLGIPYLHHRTALVYWPLMALSSFFVFYYLMRPEYHWWEKTLPFFFSVCLLVHACLFFNLSHSRSWWYDCTTKNMIMYLSKEYQGKKVSLGCNWLYHPTIKFYLRKYTIELSEPVPYEKKLRNKPGFDFYYVERSDLSKLYPDYILEKQFSYSSYLMKRKK